MYFRSRDRLREAVFVDASVEELPDHAFGQVGHVDALLGQVLLIQEPCEIVLRRESGHRFVLDG